MDQNQESLQPMQLLQVQICYAKPGMQILHDMQVIPGTTVQQAIVQSGILQRVPEIDLSTHSVGIYSKPKTLDTPLRNHDRIEIYRPLLIDPKESRRRRADIKKIKNIKNKQSSSSPSK